MSQTIVNQGIALGEEIEVLLHKHRSLGGWSDPVALNTEDLVVDNGATHLARRISGGDTASSAMAHIAVGTATTAATFTDTALTGEVARKATAINSALTNNVYSAVATFGGAAESVTSLALTEAGLFNHASSGNGVMFQRVTFASVTLANSDLLSITLQTNVGSRTI